ncbi:hypothetical protein DYBT9275_02886 [Dyadobacter sp. CECT 9275]|uniref:Uncharacterized protein n=2 Tax=Dyadobacter helix TaxID=2822344 RepID=A0A916NCJ5_9BACT|nr:hypothetical protein DYBT9275_02886 [Dyadobacter sp. CECT 9275]
MLNACTSKKTESTDLSENEQQSLTILRDVLSGQSEWVKVHAAEYLLWSGYPEGVKETFLEEEKRSGTKPPYRIGIWRVLAQAATGETEKKAFTDKIKAVFLDSTATDRTHAVETLAKLRISPLADDQPLTKKTLNGPVSPLSLYTLWSVAFTTQDSLRKAPAKLLEMILNAGDDVTFKTIPAYALRQIKGLSDQEWEQLADAALAEPAASPARVYMLSAAFTTASAGSPKREQIHAELLKYKNATSKGDVAEMAAALADSGSEDDIPLLVSLFKDTAQLSSEADKADVAASAAHAVLRIMKRNR